MEKDYIQLPPLKKGTDSKVVRVLWEYCQLTSDAKKAVEKMFMVAKDGIGDLSQEPLKEAVRFVSEKELESFHSTMKEVIGECMLEGCNLAYWVFSEIFIYGRDIEELKGENPFEEKYIEVMYQLFLNKEKRTEPESPSVTS